MTIAKVQDWIEIASDFVTESWSLFLVFGSRCAEIVIFFCLVLNILQTLGMVPASWIGTIIAVQAVTLDVASLGLMMVCKDAIGSGRKTTAWVSGLMALVLVGIMIATVVCVTVGHMWPDMQETTDRIDKALVLVRLVVSVLYGPIIHLTKRHRRHEPATPQPPAPVPANPPTPAPEESQAPRMVNIRPIKMAGLVRVRMTSVTEIHAMLLAPMVIPDDDEIAEKVARVAVTEVAQMPLMVAPPVAQMVAQNEPAKVAQMVAQNEPAKVAQMVAQNATPKASKSGTKSVTPKTREDKLEAALARLLAQGKVPSGRALSDATKINRNVATDWLKACHPEHVKSATKSATQNAIDDATESGTLEVSEWQNDATESGTEDEDESQESGIDTDPLPVIDLVGYRKKVVN